MPRIDDNGLEQRVLYDLLSNAREKGYKVTPIGKEDHDYLINFDGEEFSLLTNHRIRGRETDIAITNSDYLLTIECKNPKDNVKRRHAEDYIGRIIHQGIDQAFMIKGNGSGDYNWAGTYEAYGIILLNENNIMPLLSDVYEKKRSTNERLKRILDKRTRGGNRTASDKLRELIDYKAGYKDSRNKPLEAVLDDHICVSHINDFPVDNVNGSQVFVSADLLACNDHKVLIGGAYHELTTPIVSSLIGKAVIAGWPWTKGLAVYSEINSNALELIEKYDWFIKPVKVSAEELEAIKASKPLITLNTC